MNQAEASAVFEVLNQALDAHRRTLEALIDEATAEHIDAARAVGIAEERVGAAEDRLRLFVQQRTSEVSEAIRHAAAAEVAQLQGILIQRVEAANALTDRLGELRENLQRTLAELKDGPSAYQVALDEGFDGTPAEWLATLRGAPGRDAPVVESKDVAMDLALDESFRVLVRGADGVGILAPVWKAGIHREGALVQAHIGQFYRARADTAAEPGDSGDWERIGTAGFRLAPPWGEGRSYRPGDLFVRDFGLFTWTEAGAQLLVGRGAKGEPGLRGDPGWPGKPGTNGRDGSDIEVMELRGGTLAVVVRDANGALREHVLDLVPMLESCLELARDLADKARADVPELVRAHIEDVVLRHPRDPEAIPMRFFRGLWSGDRAFERGDVVVYGMGLWLARETSHGVIPGGKHDGAQLWRALVRWGDA